MTDLIEENEKLKQENSILTELLVRCRKEMDENVDYWRNRYVVDAVVGSRTGRMIVGRSQTL